MHLVGARELNSYDPGQRHFDFNLRTPSVLKMTEDLKEHLLMWVTFIVIYHTLKQNRDD